MMRLLQPVASGTFAKNSAPIAMRRERKATTLSDCPRVLQDRGRGGEAKERMSPWVAEAKTTEPDDRT